MKPGLPRLWVRWRRYRFQALVAAGVGPEITWGIAKAEAELRRQAARSIGFKAACEVPIKFVQDRHGKVHAMLSQHDPLTDHLLLTLNGLIEIDPLNGKGHPAT